MPAAPDSRQKRISSAVFSPRPGYVPHARRLHTRRAASRTAGGYASGSNRLHTMSISGFQRRPLAWPYSSRRIGFSVVKRRGKRRSRKRFSWAW